MLKMNRPDAEQSALSLEKRFETTLTAALKAIHSATSPDSTTPEDLERQRKGQELLGRMVTPMLGMRWEPFEIGGMPAAWVRPEQGGTLRLALPAGSKVKEISGATATDTADADILTLQTEKGKTVTLTFE